MTAGTRTMNTILPAATMVLTLKVLAKSATGTEMATNSTEPRVMTASGTISTGKILISERRERRTPNHFPKGHSWPHYSI